MTSWNYDEFYSGFAQCKGCKALYRSGAAIGTKNLIDHRCDQSLSGNQSITKFIKKSVSMADRKMMTKSMVKLCAYDLRPFEVDNNVSVDFVSDSLFFFKIVNGVGFRDVICTSLILGARIGPDSVDELLPCPNTIKNNLEDAATFCKEAFKKEVEEVNKHLF